MFCISNVPTFNALLINFMCKLMWLLVDSGDVITVALTGPILHYTFTRNSANFQITDFFHIQVLAYLLFCVCVCVYFFLFIFCYFGLPSIDFLNCLFNSGSQGLERTPAGSPRGSTPWSGHQSVAGQTHKAREPFT